MLAGANPESVSGRLLTADAMNAHNAFADPDALFPVPFTGVRLARDKVTAVLPAKSVAVLAIR